MKLIISTILIIILSCNAKTSDKNTDSITNKEILQTPSNIHIDSVNNFQIAYPTNWRQVAPTSSKTVFKIGNLDSMLSLSVNIQEKEPGIDNLPLSEEALSEKAKVLTAAHISMGDKIIKLKVLNYDIGIRKVVATIWYQAIKVSDNNNIINVSNDFEFNVGNKRYSVSLKGPVKYLDEKTSMYYIEKYVESFRILNETPQNIVSNSEEKRNEDGLLLKSDLIFKTMGKWSAKGSANSIDGVELNRLNFQFKFNKDATGEMRVFISTVVKSNEEAFALSFHIYPWGIANNKSNVDMFYLSISGGKLESSTSKDKTIEKRISDKVINAIQKTRGFTAVVSTVSSREIVFKSIEPNGFYPEVLSKE